jgi:hypothetical protein
MKKVILILLAISMILIVSASTRTLVGNCQKSYWGVQVMEGVQVWRNTRCSYFDARGDTSKTVLIKTYEYQWIDVYK